MFNGTLINPVLTTPDTFQFRVLSPDNSYSAPVTQFVTVINVNDPTEIDISKLSSSPKVRRLWIVISTAVALNCFRTA